MPRYQHRPLGVAATRRPATPRWWALFPLAGWWALSLLAGGLPTGGTAHADDEAALFTPPGFQSVGLVKVAEGADTGLLNVAILDRKTGRPAFCRVNVVGPDGHYYQPLPDYLTPFALTGQWPKTGRGNRLGKGPFRYYGRFFYSTGRSTVRVPAGQARVEVWKGFEFRPQHHTVEIVAGKTAEARIVLQQPVSMSQLGYYSGDPHIHITRASEEDDNLLLDLMEAEDIHFGALLAYNDPPGPYRGVMDEMDMPQRRGLGERSVARRGDYHIISGQEYRSRTYGHLNVYLQSDLLFQGQDLNADHWPAYGLVGQQVKQRGGVALYAHGGYAQAIYADFVQGHVDAVELLQFGVYRGIGLDDWYHILNIGYRFPATGACDYPACRKLGDSKTYVRLDGQPDFPAWLRGAAAGRSFITTGPLLLLEVDGRKPGDAIHLEGDGPHRVSVRIRVRSEVAPVENVQLVVNGRIEAEIEVPPGRRQREWFELERNVELAESSWIAARAYSTSASGSPDGEAHTNPVYVYSGQKAPFNGKSLDALLERLDGQIAAHAKREFAEQSKILAYFERSRDVLLTIRAAGGVPAKGHPADFAGKSLESIGNAGMRTHSEEELKEYLKPVPPKSAEESLKSFETVDGFRMELVAAEPLVVDPIAAAFDENGNLYVAEMRDYPYVPKEGDKPLGTLRLLIDTDGDGRFDRSHVFAEHLLWPAGVACWKGGVYVAAPPDVWYLKDTDGDHRADVRQKVYTGFGTSNQQAMVNNLKFGLDHKIYGTTAGNGGTIRPADDPGAEGISVNGRDFRFDPVSGRFETISGTVQFGHTMDDWGNRFLCNQAKPLHHVVLPQRYLARNPYLAVSKVIQNIAPGPVPIFRISPIERWRHIRSSRRVAHSSRAATTSGASQHVIDAAAGSTVYRGGAYPEEYYGNVFVGGSQHNLIHRRVLTPDGVTFRSSRADQRTEFVRSSDNWFRPVNFVNAPDGTLYVLDMSREIIESIHIPIDVVKHLDLTNGRDRGRIYRLAPPGFKYPGAPKLGRESTTELVAQLENPHGWHRDTAHRLLYQRQDATAVAPLRRLLEKSSLPQARLHALWSLEGLTHLTDDDLDLALSDDCVHVRRHAMILAEGRLDRSRRLLDRVAHQAEDPSAVIRFQVAFTLGASKSDLAVEALATVARASVDDSRICTAVLSSSTERADRLFALLAVDAAFVKRAEGVNLLGRLAQIVGARNRRPELDRVLEVLATHANFAGPAELPWQLAGELGSGLKRSGAHLLSDPSGSSRAARFVEKMMADAERVAMDRQASDDARTRAIRLLGFTPFSRAGGVLAGLLTSAESKSVQVAAVRALSDYAEGKVADVLLEPWHEFAPEVRSAVTEALLAHRERTVRFLQASLEGAASVVQVDSTRRSLLLDHRDPSIRQLAKKLFDDASGNPITSVLAEYREALELDSDKQRGGAVFERECMKCHKLNGKGYEVGPDLASSSTRDPEVLLSHILDPNGYVPPEYIQYVVIDDRGLTSTGIVAAETTNSVTLKRENDETTTILRSNLDTLFSTDKSMMPEGHEKTINKQEMADLIAYLQASQADVPVDQPPLDIGTLPGLAEPD